MLPPISVVGWLRPSVLWISIASAATSIPVAYGWGAVPVCMGPTSLLQVDRVLIGNKIDMDEKRVRYSPTRTPHGEIIRPVCLQFLRGGSGGADKAWRRTGEATRHRFLRDFGESRHRC